jgi:Ca-activated chloride channel family protein
MSRPTTIPRPASGRPGRPPREERGARRAPAGLLALLLAGAPVAAAPQEVSPPGPPARGTQASSAPPDAAPPTRPTDAAFAAAPEAAPPAGSGAAPTAGAEAPPARSEATDAEAAALEPAAARATAENPHGLQQRHRDWLEAAEPLITRDERSAFLELARDYQRDAFIDRFWRMRDPYLETARNELKERFEEMVGLVRGTYGTFEDDRARVLLVHGPPHGGFQVLCTKTRIPAELWAYQRSEVVDFPFVLIFLRNRLSGPARIWRPAEDLRFDQAIELAKNCINGDQLNGALAAMRREGPKYEQQLNRVLAKPRPRSEEWLATFAAFSTEVAPDAAELPAELAFGFPGRRDGRTVVQGLLTVPRQAVTVGEFAGYRSADFQLVGEVIAGGRLFENFRYKFGFPVETLPHGVVPLAFQRYLRPGDYTLILRLEDLNGDAVTRLECPLSVPAVEELIAEAETTDPEVAGIFAEATAAIAAGETSVRIMPPPGTIYTGLVRIDTVAVGPEIDRVAFYLDERLVMTKNRPPFNVELDLGPAPEPHTLRVVAFDPEGRDVARDEEMLNAGGNRFAVRLVEPRRGTRYERSLRAHAEVEVPQGRSVERVEFFLNEQPVATLYQPPWVQPVVVPEDSELTYVRAVAYLPDGLATEDVVFVNAPENLEEMDVQFVELYTSALDGAGRPVEGLGQGDFRVFEDGVEQSIARFDLVRDLPIHAGVLIDNSGSMQGSLEAAQRAALTFFSQAITPRDHAALITFNKFPHLAVKLTNNLQTLGGGLAGLTAEGETALYDSLIFGLYYFAGLKGQRALLVLSDGKDEASRFSFEETLEYARRAGVTVYTIGLGLREIEARRKLTTLAEETGGRSFFVGDAADLEEIYRSIERELRSQYLIAYQSTNTSDKREFREVELKAARPGVKVQTISGYYP